MAAFLALDDRIESSEKTLDRVIELTNRGEPLEVSQLMSYNNIKLGKLAKAEIFAGSSCDKYDGLNCWISSLINTWQEALLLERKDQLVHGKKFEYLPEKLSLLIKNEPLKETNSLDQKKIEEMDNNLINLLPETD